MVADDRQKGSGNGGPAKRGPARHYTVRDFFRKPDKHSFTIAPDGKHLSFLARHAGRQNVFVQGVDAEGNPIGEPRPLTSETERDVPGHAWKGNDHILFVKDFGGDENFHVLSVPIDGGSVTLHDARAAAGSTASGIGTGLDRDRDANCHRTRP